MVSVRDLKQTQTYSFHPVKLQWPFLVDGRSDAREGLAKRNGWGWRSLAQTLCLLRFLNLPVCCELEKRRESIRKTLQMLSRWSSDDVGVFYHPVT